jgi:hypothetical protein
VLVDGAAVEGSADAIRARSEPAVREFFADVAEARA